MMESPGLQNIRRSAAINAQVHRAIAAMLAPGITTADVDNLAAEVMHRGGGSSSFTPLGFPGHICVSVNDEIGHGVPGKRVLREGDVVKVDVGVAYEGYHSDAAATHIIGVGTETASRICSTTKQAMMAGIRKAIPGHRVSDVSHAVYRVVREAGYDTIRHAFGHGVGETLHEDPQIANFGPPGMGVILRQGMVLAIEPVVVGGARYTRTKLDGWTTQTLDGAVAAHWEHTVLVGESGAEILTDWENDGAAAACEADHPGGTLRFRDKSAADHDWMLSLARRTMNAILVEAWGRSVDPMEVLHPQDATTVIVEDTFGERLGFFTYSLPGPLHLNTLAVEPNQQGCGFGRRIMAELEGIARRHGKSAIELWVQDNNVRAVHFYRRLGYSEIGRPYYRTLRMKKRLS